MQIVKAIHELRHARNIPGQDILDPVSFMEIRLAFRIKERAEQAKKVSDVFTGLCFRGVQTALGIAVTAGIKAKLHAPLPELGSDDLIKQIVTPEILKRLDNEDLFDVLEEVHGKEQSQVWGEYAASGVRKMFEMMEGDYALSIGHLPLIPMGIKALGGKPRFLNYLEGRVYLLDADGKINVI